MIFWNWFGQPHFLLLIVVVVYPIGQATGTAVASSSSLGIAAQRDDYQDHVHRKFDLKQSSRFGGWFDRFQSPQQIQNMCQQVVERKKRNASFSYFKGKDGRYGQVRSCKLEDDYVLAESIQVAPNCTCEQVMYAYLNGDLQKKWNADTLVDCDIQKCVDESNKRYYRQDLTLQSQQVIARQTGIMKYRQRIVVDRVGRNSYCIAVQLDNDDSSHAAMTTTSRKPFEQLHVYVSLEQKAQDVHIYAAGVMKVNRKVIPNLVVFDASGIAGSMAGKGTLWLAAQFRQ